MDYGYYYNNARSRYYNACSEISSCNSRLSDLRSQQQQKINLINQLKTDIKNNEDAFAGVSQIIRNEGDMNTKILDISNKTSQAADNYLGMVISSDVTSKNLSDVFSVEMTNTKSKLSNIFESLKTKENMLKNKITDLNNQLQRAESELQDIVNSIVATESSLRDWSRIKSSASNDMEYYRRKMNQER